MTGFEKVNGKVVKTDVSRGPVLARRGAMLAYTGDVRFMPAGGGMPGGGMGGMGGMGGGLGGMMGGMMGAAGRAMAGEHVSMMAAEGRGEVWYGFRGSNVTVIPLNGADMLQVEADRLLAHDANMQSSVVFIGSGGVKQAIRGAISGQGMATTQISGMGSVAVLSHGGTIEIQVQPGQTVGVDPQAYVAALGNLTIDVAASVGWRDAVGKGSGEAIQLKVTGQGRIYVQASEQKF